MKMFLPGKIGCFGNMAYQKSSEKDEIFTNLKPKFRFNIIENVIVANSRQMRNRNDTDSNFGIQEKFVKDPIVLNIHTDSNDKSLRESYCRLCASIVPASCLTPLSDSKDGISFIDKIMFCFSEKVQVHIHDGLPQQICNSCIVQLNACHNILETLIKANLKLQKLFKPKRLPVVEVMDNYPVKHIELNLPVKEMRLSNLSVTQKVSNSSQIQRLSNPPGTQKENNLFVIQTVPKLPVTQRTTNQPVKQRETNPTVKQIKTILSAIEIDPIPLVNEIEPYQFVKETENSSPVQDIEPSLPVQDIERKTSMNVEPAPLKLSTQPIDQKSDHLENENNEGSNNYNNTHRRSVKIEYQCMFCRCLFETKETVAQHFISTHPIPADSKMVCKIIKTEVNENDTKPSVIVSETSNVTEEKFFSTDKAIYSINYQCLVCSLVFQQKDSFIMHTVGRHQALGKNRFACKIIQTEKLLCTECNAFFSNYKLYRKHMWQHRLYKCAECNLSFDKMYKLKVHKRNHKPQETIPRALCKTKILNTESELVQEDHDYFKPRKFRCTTCFEVFDSRFLVRKHQRVHKSRLCNECGKLFAPSYLQTHIQTHSDQRPYSCNACLKSFKTMNTLKRHQRTHENNNGLKFICQYCGKLFRTMQVLRQHLLTHSPFMPHACNICGVTFNRRYSMLKHRKCHESLAQHLPVDTPFECGTCKKQFATQKQYTIHARVHSDERLYVCKMCGKYLRTSASLRRHKLIHENVFPHECNYCDRKFRWKQSLIAHKKTHTGNRPHACPECGCVFANRGNMIKHRRSHMRSFDAAITGPLSHKDNSPELSKDLTFPDL